MDYKKMMGYSDKPKTQKIQKTKKPTLAENLMKEFDEFDLEMGKVYTDKDLPPFKTEQKINETIPAFAKQRKNMTKACDILEKSVNDLSKSVNKVDKASAKTINGLWKSTYNDLKKFKEILSKQVLDKLQ